MKHQTAAAMFEFCVESYISVDKSEVIVNKSDISCGESLAKLLPVNKYEVALGVYWVIFGFGGSSNSQTFFSVTRSDVRQSASE